MTTTNGTLHIATTHTQAKYFLPTPIQRFKEKYPAIRIYIVQASPEQLIDQLSSRKADLAICTEKIDQATNLLIESCYQWHHAAVVPHGHPLCKGEITLERLASFPILTYNTDFAGRSTIERAFHEANIELDITLAAADTDIIKTYVRLGMGVGLIAAMAYHTTLDADLVVRDLSQVMPKSSTKIATLKHNYLPLYGQHFIEELRLAGREFA